MRSSFYNFYFNIQGRNIIYNSLNSTIIEVDSDLHLALKCDKFDTEKYSEAVLNQLSELGLIVKDTIDECNIYFEKFQDFRDKGILYIQLFLATSCNLNCNYCYLETPLKSGMIIKKNALDSFIRWVREETSKAEIHKCYMEFYGGEPLLARRSLPWLFKELDYISKENLVEFSYSLITNGTLLDERLIKLLISHSTYLQITLDGLKGSHDIRRVMKNGEGSFNLILNNIQNILRLGGNDLLKVRMNIDNENWNEIPSLADLCHSLGIKNFEVGWVYFNSPISPEYCKQISEERFENLMIDLYKILEPYGYAPTIDDFTILTTCMLHRYHGYVISPELNVFKCDELVDLEQFKVGYINKEGKLILDPYAYAILTNRNPANFPECTKCRCLPVCGSGCAVKAWHSKGSIHSSFCETNEEKLRIRVENYLTAMEFKSDNS